MDIVDWAQSKYGYYVDRHYRAGRWVVKPAPIRLASYHTDLLRHIFTPGTDGRLPYDVVAWCEPAKSGKSALAGLMAEYACLHLDTNSTVVLASNKRKQAASLMFKSLVDSIDLNPHLPNVEAGKYEVTFRNGNRAVAIPSRSRGEAGARHSLALFDELWGYVYTDAVRLWSEFKTDPTRLHSVKVAIGYAGYTGESELWQEVLNTGLKGESVPDLAHITNDGEPACWRNGRHFVFWSHQCRQPWQTDDWIGEQRKSLRAPDFQRMILCEFAEGAGDFVSSDDWAACIDSNLRPLPPGSDHQVYVGLDLATAASGDAAALAGVYFDDGLLKLAFHRIWQGRRERLRLSETVFPFLLEAKQNYRLVGLWFDPFQAYFLTELLQKAGLACYEVHQTHASRGPKDTFLWQLVADRRLVLYDHPEVRRAPLTAGTKELGNGLLFITKVGTRAKTDLLIALSNVADEAGQPTGVFFKVLDLPDPTPAPRPPGSDSVPWRGVGRLVF